MIKRILAIMSVIMLCSVACSTVVKTAKEKCESIGGVYHGKGFCEFSGAD